MLEETAGLPRRQWGLVRETVAYDTSTVDLCNILGHLLGMKGYAASG